MTEDYELLKAENYRLNGEIGLMQLEINALRNQRDNALEMIRRMKCCGNCKYSSVNEDGFIICTTDCFYDCKSSQVFDNKESKIDKWELTE